MYQSYPQLLRYHAFFHKLVDALNTLQSTKNGSFEVEIALSMINWVSSSLLKRTKTTTAAYALVNIFLTADADGNFLKLILVQRATN